MVQRAGSPVMQAKRRRVILLTRRYGGEVGATNSRLSAYVGALQNEGAEVIVITRFPFVHPGRKQEAQYARRLYLRERIDGATVLRLRVAGRRILELLLERAVRWHARLRGARGPLLISLELMELLHGLLALPLIVVLRPRWVVVEQGPAWLALPVWILSRLGIPLVLQVSDVKSLAMRNGQYGAVPAAQIHLNRRLENVLYRRATAIVTVTEAQRGHIAERLGADGREVHLIPNGAELEVFERIDAGEKQSYKRRLGLGGKFVVLYAGTFGAAHDLWTLLEAARELRHVSEIAFLLLGGGPLEQQLMKTAAYWGLDNVTFRPGVPVPMLTPFLGAADAGVSTEIGGLRDTVRSKIYLYMAGRLPVIATDDGGEVRALVTRAGSGHLVPPRDAAAIAARLLDLKCQPDIAAALGENGRRFVERYHDRTRLAQRFARVVLRGSQVAGLEWRAQDASLSEPRPETDCLRQQP